MASSRSAATASTKRRRTRASLFGAETSEALGRARRNAPGPSADLVEAFVARGARALARIAQRMPRERLIEAVGAETDTDALFRSLQDAAAVGAEISPDVPDPLTAAYLRGAEIKRALLKAEG